MSFDLPKPTSSFVDRDGQVNRAWYLYLDNLQRYIGSLSGVIPVTSGGTGLTSGTSGGILGFTAATTIASSVLLTANALVLGGGVGATPVPMASLGTTTTVLHGNALGAPTFSAVSLTADVSGVLPTASGGTNLSTYSQGDSLYASAVNTLAKLGIGSSGKIYQSNGTIPSWSSFTLPTSAATGDLIYGSALNTWSNLTIVTSGKVLQSNGTIPVWSTSSLPTTATRGDMIYASAANTWSNRAISTAGKMLRSDGTDPQWSTFTSVDTYASGAIPHASSSNTLTALTIGPSAGQLLRSTGTLPAWSTPTFPNTATANKALVGDGTNIVLSTPTIPLTSSPSSGKVMIGDGTNWVASTPTYPNAAPGAGTFLRGDGTNFVTSTLTLPNASTSGGVLYSSAADTVATSGVLGSTQVVTGGGAGVAPSTSANFTSTGTVLTFAAGSVADADTVIFTRTSTIVSAGTKGLVHLTQTVNPASNGGSGVVYAAGYYTNNFNSATNITSSVVGSYYEAQQLGAGTLTTLDATRLTVTQSASTGAVSNMRGALASMGVAATATNVQGFRHVATVGAAGAILDNSTAFIAMAPSITAGGTIWNSIGMQVNNLGATGVSFATGIAIQNQSGASSGNINLMLGNVPAISGTFSIYNVSANKNIHSGPTFFGGTTTPTAIVHLVAGTTAASTAPLKFTTGTSMTSTEAGAMEYTTDDLFFTISTGTARKRILFADPVGGLTSGRVPVVTTNGRLTDASTFTSDGVTVGIGGALNTAVALIASNTALTGTAQIAFSAAITANSSATGSLRGFQSGLATAASAFTCADVWHFKANDVTVGAGSSVTRQAAFHANDLTGATTNYGFRGQVSSGSNKYNLYMEGTADNFLEGVIQHGATSISANNAQTVTVGNVGPGSAGISILEWQKVKNSGGTTRYVPLFG